MTQPERLLQHLKAHGTINPLESWVELGIYRLSAVIYILRKAGWNITTKKVTIKNKWDEDCRVGEYKLVDDGQEHQSVFPAPTEKPAEAQGEDGEFALDDPRVPADPRLW